MIRRSDTPDPLPFLATNASDTPVRVDANPRRRWHDSTVLLDPALPKRCFDALGVPRNRPVISDGRTARGGPARAVVQEGSGVPLPPPPCRSVPWEARYFKTVVVSTRPQTE